MGFFNRKKSPAAKAPGDKDNQKKVEEAKKAPEPAKKTAPAVTGEAHRVLIRPLVTEKSTALSKHGQYAFEVAFGANKIEIRQAIKSVYGVTPLRVHVMTILGKPVRTQSGYSRRSAWRKAIVSLKKGETLDVFANA